MPTVEQKISASNAAAGNEFGASVAMSRNGSTLVIGAVTANSNKGAVYVYRGAGFATETILTASDGMSGDDYGLAVAVSDDGSVIVVGSPLAVSGAGKGKAYIYSGPGWGTQTIVTGSDLAGPSDFFGGAVAISGDGLVVGAGASGWSSSKGKAYLYHGAAYATEKKFTGTGTSSSSQFGSGVALSSDGSVFAVGARNVSGGVSNAGKAFIYDGISWGTETVLTAAIRIVGGQFGSSIALSDDGSVVVVGSLGNRSPGGTVYVKSGASYATETILAASDGQTNDNFGCSVGITADGLSVVVGALFGGISTPGQAYTYSGASYATERIFSASDGVSGNEFGGSVAFKDSDLVLVGAVGWGPAGSGDATGIAYLYTTTEPPPPDTDKIGICVAFGYDAYDTDAVFTRIDDPLAPGLAWSGTSTRSVKSWSSDRGRAYELDKTQTGTAQIVLLDDTGIFDSTNADGPLYGKITPMMQAKINVLNPADLSYHDIFTGFVESWEWTFADASETIMVVTIGLVDGFEPLTRGELQPQSTGVTLIPGDISSAACQNNLNKILDFAGWPRDGLPGPSSSWRNLNTGNVRLKDVTYNPQTSFLAAMQDIADAEFPGVANIFINKKGAVTFYGRYPRFQPSNYPEDVDLWQAADKPGLAPADGAALIADITWALDSKNLINASLCMPFGIAQSAILGQLVTDPGSVAKYGIRTLSLPDLIVDGQNAGGGISPQPSATANEVCVFYAQYYVDNYAEPELRISKLEFHSRNAGDSQTWGLIMGVEIGDLISVWTSNPGGGGFGKETFGEGVISQFFVEGIHNVVAGQLHTNVPDWTMALDVSPRAWFATAPFGD